MREITLTPTQIEHITTQNLNSTQIKKYIGCSYPTVRTLCEKYKISPNSDGRKYKPNDDYFKTWSNEMAYFLGLIVGDGHVRKQNNLLMINLKQTDEHIIYSLKSALQYEGPIYTINKTQGQTQSSLTITSSEIVNDLTKLGLTGNKTFDFDWINNMSSQYIPHFIRGVFDADGCIYINILKGNFETTIVGTYKLTQNIKNYYNTLCNNTVGHLAPKNNVQSIDFNGKYNSLAFLDWIYSDSTPETRLKRKYDLYCHLKNKICEEIKPPNNAKINQQTADNIREMHQHGITVKRISEILSISEHIIHDATQNRTWIDEEYTPLHKKQDIILITYNNKTQTIKDWSTELNIPYSTIDRRYREYNEGKIKSLDDVFNNEGKRLSLGKTLSEKEKRAFEVATTIRNEYKNGLIGKALYEKYNIPKSRYIDIILNRTCKEDVVWWK